MADIRRTCVRKNFDRNSHAKLGRIDEDLAPIHVRRFGVALIEFFENFLLLVCERLAKAVVMAGYELVQLLLFFAMAPAIRTGAHVAIE